MNLKAEHQLTFRRTRSLFFDFLTKFQQLKKLAIILSAASRGSCGFAAIKKKCGMW
jgi:hypothetical protein